jgi:hypothetical protein
LKSVDVACTGSKKVLGGGYTVFAESGDAAQINISLNYPNSDSTWTVLAEALDDALIGNWEVGLWVICADVGA